MPDESSPGHSSREHDALVRTAVRGMLPPEHRPDFWDELAGRLDAASDAAGDAARIATVFGRPGSLDDVPAPRPRERTRPAAARPPAHRAGDHPPRRAPLRVTIDAPTAAVPAVVAAAAVAPAAVAPAPRPAPAPGPRPGPVVAPVAAAPRRQVHVPKVKDPLAGLKVRHDAATMPHVMRRTSNVVLLSLALCAVVIVVIAGLSLVRQRSESGAPPVHSTAVEQAAAASADLAA